MEKHCYCCKVNKDVSLFGNNKSKPDGLGSECKECKRNFDVKYKQKLEVKERNRANALEWYKNNTEYAKEKMKAVSKRWKEENRDKYNAKAAKYRASKLQATPSWLTEEDFKKIETEYSLAVWTSLVMASSYHVDHIVPLQGKTVCGLHVPWNLRVIPATVNISKGNRIDK